MFAGWNSMFVCYIPFQNQHVQQSHLFNHGHEHALFYILWFLPSFCASNPFLCFSMFTAPSTCRSQCTRLRSVEQLIPWNLAGSTGGRGLVRSRLGLDSIWKWGYKPFQLPSWPWMLRYQPPKLMYTPSKRGWNWGEQIRNYNRNLRTWRYEIGFQKGVKHQWGYTKHERLPISIWVVLCHLDKNEVFVAYLIKHMKCHASVSMAGTWLYSEPGPPKIQENYLSVGTLNANLCNQCTNFVNMSDWPIWI